MKTRSTISFHATEDVIAWWLQIDNPEPGRLINKLIQDHYIKPNSITTNPTHTEEQVEVHRRRRKNDKDDDGN